MKRSKTRKILMRDNTTLQKRFSKLVRELVFELLEDDVPSKVFMQTSNGDQDIFDFGGGTCDVIITITPSMLSFNVHRYNENGELDGRPTVLD